MKKTLLFAFALLFATATMAQNRATIFQESFNGSSLPSGWSIQGSGTTNWHIASTNNAGGSPNEVLMYWDPQFNGTSRLVTPPMDMTGISSVVFSFKHALNNYSGGHTLGVATTSDGGTTWNVGHQQTYSASNSWEVMWEIATPDMGQNNVQFCIFYTGNSYNMNYWYFDDIWIFTLENLDLSVNAVNIDEIVAAGETTIGFAVKNYGQTAVTGVQATYEIEGFEPVTETMLANIPKLGSANLTFSTPINLNPGVYTVNVNINKVNGVVDDNPDNNFISRSFTVAAASVERIPMIEHFTSSTCGPCVSVNNQMLTFCNNNPGAYTYTKYQMNWPGNGDPYYTEEGGVRRAYYGVSGVPSVFIDSQSSTPVTQAIFNQHAADPGYFDVRGSYNVDGNNIHVVVDIMPYATVTERVYISINEKITTGNVGSNGETQFRHVMMKMLPDGEGTTVDFVAGELLHLEFNQNMSSTHVEEMSDLEVAIWIQNYDNQIIYNSRYAYEYTDLHPYPVDNLSLVQDGTAYTASWVAPAQGNPVGYNVYVNDELVAENINATTYSFVGDENLFTVVGVTALYADNKSSVRSIAAASEPLQDEGLIAGEQSIMLDENQTGAELVATNANHNSQADITIIGVDEMSEDGQSYLDINHEELPYALGYGESFRCTISPIAPAGKSVAHTKVIVTFVGGEIVYLVSIDGELLSVTEVSDKAKLYPNPANDQVRIVANNNIESVKVYNMMGALVETIPANGMSMNVNLSQYSNGIYFFSIRQSDGNVSNQRVVVSH